METSSINTLKGNSARWTNGFWASRRQSCREAIVPDLWDKMKGTSPTHYLHNFNIAAGLEEGLHRWGPFNDGDFYKWMEAVCYLLPDAEPAWRETWDRVLDESIAIIAQAQRADGYLHTKVLIAERNGTPDLTAWQVPTDFELYNMGHLFTASCAHFEVTGKTSFLEIARKTADFLDELFQTPRPNALKCSVCPSHYMGLAELARVTGEPRYLSLADRLIAWRHLAPDGGDDNQDRIPFKEQHVAAGHAVRANYLFAGAADVWRETGDVELGETLEHLWTDVVSKKLYLTGGCGALYDGASPDGAVDQDTISRVHQSYGRAFQLPNQTAHNETCAAIGSVLWNWRMFLKTGEARFVDLVESTLFNGVLCGATLDGTSYSYTNPLRFLDDKPAMMRYGGGARAPFVSSFCCPPNLARILASSHGYAYAKSSHALWVTLFGNGEVETDVDGETVKLRQETNYPWEGAIRIFVDEAPATPFSLNIRIPNWAEAATLKINGEAFNGIIESGTFCELSRLWAAGDVVGIEFPLEVQLVEAHPLVEETLNQLAVVRGPLVYCLESPDLPDGTHLGEISLSTSTHFESHLEADLLGGIVVLEGNAQVRQNDAWNGALYRPVTAAKSREIPLRLIPYFAWNNRGVSEMSVWLPRAD